MNRLGPAFFQNGHCLRTGHTRKAFEEFFERIASLDMIEQTPDGHPSPFENQFTTEDIG